MKKVVVTGGLSSGKTTVCNILSNHGAYQLNSDSITHELLSTNKHVINQTIALLGPPILTNGAIDRSKVAQLVFSDDSKLRKLEAILHPLLFKHIEEEYLRVLKGNKHSLFVAEVPLVQETKMEVLFDVVIAIFCEEKEALERSPFSYKEFKQRSKCQWPPTKKAQYADYVIINNGSPHELQHQVLNLLETLLK